MRLSGRIKVLLNDTGIFNKDLKRVKETLLIEVLIA